MRAAPELISEERQRQISQEGYSHAHDDGHTDGQIARAAACYIADAGYQAAGKEPPYRSFGVPIDWPWGPLSWKPSPDPKRNLAKGGALAEIERLQRMEILERQQLEGIPQMSNSDGPQVRLVSLARELKAITGQDIGVTISEAQTMNASELAEKIRDFGFWWKNHCEDISQQVEQAIYNELESEENPQS